MPPTALAVVGGISLLIGVIQICFSAYCIVSLDIIINFVNMRDNSNLGSCDDSYATDRHIY